MNANKRSVIGTVSLLIFSLLGLIILPGQAGATPWWQAYFTDGGGNISTNSVFENRIKEFMSKATNELDIESYTWGGSSTNEVVNEANAAFSNGLNVRIVGDGEKGLHPGLDPSIPRTLDPSGDPITHSKFIIRDPGTANAGLMISTNNFTEGGFSSQPGMMVIVENFPELINSFKQEFDERFNGTFHGGSSTTNNLTAPTGETVESYFSPEDDPINTVLTDAITNANNSVFFMALLQTNTNLSEAAVTAHSNGALVEGLMDQCSFCDSVKNDYWSNGIDFRIDDAGDDPRQHHKTYIIDLETVMVGSANHTVSASNSNDENITFFNDPALAREVMQDFHRHYDDNDVSSNLSGSPSHEDSAPGPLSSIDAQPTPTSGQSLTIEWNSSPPTDFDRYYVFIDTKPITTETSHAGSNIPVQRPEVGTITDPTQNSVELTTVNDGESLENGKDYYVGVSMTDHHANESTVLTTGPVAPQPADPNADGTSKISFKDGASKRANQPSTLRLNVTNQKSGSARLTNVTVQFDNGSNPFTVESGQPSPPAGWEIDGTSSDTIAYSETAGGLAAGESDTFFINVINPKSPGSSADITASFDDANGFTESENMGSLSIESGGAIISSSVSSPDTENRAGRATTLDVDVSNLDTSASSVTQVTVNGGKSGDHSYRIQSLSNQSPPSGWNISSLSNQSITYEAGDSVAYLDPGDSELFPVRVYNPRSSGTSDNVVLDVVDDTGNTSSDTVGQLSIDASPDIIFNEFMYNPASGDDDLEWVEIRNRNQNSAIQLDGWTATVSGDTIQFSDQVISAGGFIILANELTDSNGNGLSFSDSYPSVSVPSFDMDFLLDNNRDSLELVSGDKTYSVALTYDDSLSEWGTNADNTGKTFEKIDPSIDDTNQPDVDGQNWRPSGLEGGTPGEANSGGLTNVQSISVTDGVNTITTLEGSRQLQLNDNTINVSFDREVSDTPVLFWDTANDPDGNGGSSTDEQVFPTPDNDGNQSTWEFVIPTPDPELLDGVTPEFLIKLGSQTFDNSGQFYSWTIDNQVSSPTNLSDSNVGISSVDLGWETINDADFQEYRIYCGTSSPVTTQGTPCGTQTSNVGEGTASGLQDNTSYFINITAVDSVGNESTIDTGTEISVQTNQGFEVDVLNADDGKNTISTFDGSQVLRDEDVTVNFTTDNAIAQSEVSLFYDVGDTPDGSTGSNGNDREVSATGSDTSWQATIPASDPEITDDVTVQFIVETKSQIHDTDGVSYRYQVQSADQIPSVKGFQAADTRGGEADFTWDSVSDFSDFGTYRIYYTEASGTVSLQDSSWDVDHDPTLDQINQQSTTLQGLKPGTKYEFKIAVVDKFGNVGSLSKKVTVTTNLLEALLITEFDVYNAPGDGINHDWIEIYALEGPVDLRNLIVTDIDSTDGAVVDERTTLKQGQYAVVHDAVQTNETDGNGDLNGNGVVDVFNDTDLALPNTSDEIVLQDANTGDTIDAVAYRSDLGQPIDSAEIQDHLVPDHWESNNTEDIVTTFTGNAVDFKPHTVRKRTGSGPYEDTERWSDWEATTEPTPGRTNQYLQLQNVTLSDSTTSESNQRQHTISTFETSNRLKLSSEEKLTFSLNQQPVRIDDLQLWYAGNGSPVGRAKPESSTAASTNVRVPLTTSYDSATQSLSVSQNLFTNVNHDSTVRFFVSSENTASNDTPNAEVKLFNVGTLFVFRIDDRSPPSPAGVDGRLDSSKTVRLSWSPPSDPGDFSHYRILYDTGTVTQQSNVWNHKDDSNLTNNKTSSTLVAIDSGADTYFFRVGTVDDIGNRSAISPSLSPNYSDTIAIETFDPINLSNLDVTEDTNTYSRSTLLDKDARFQSDSVVVTASFEKNAETVSIVWNKAGNGVPDRQSDTTIQMNQVNTTTYRGTIPRQPNNERIRFRVFSKRAGWFPADPDVFGYTVDDNASDPIDSFDLGSQDPGISTNVYVTWNPIDNKASDFREYRVFYNKGTSVSTSDSFVGPSKNSILSDSRTAGSVISGLDGDDTYSLAVRWVDSTGNISPLPQPDTILVKTLAEKEYEDPATDGINVAHDLFGNEYLRDTDVTITFEFSSLPLNPDQVKIHYTANDQPSLSDTAIDMELISNDQNAIFRGTISGSSPVISHGNKVKYFVLTADGRQWDNSGEPFQFQIDGNKPSRLSGVNVYDYGDYLKVSWDNVSITDFQEYEIRYRKVGDDQWTRHNGSDNSDLKNSATTSGWPSGLDPSANYYVNVSAVDRVQYRWWQTNDIILQRTESDSGPRLETDKQLFVVEPGDTVQISSTILDLGGNPWTDQSLTFSATSSHGSLVGSSTRTSDSNGQADVVFETDPDRGGYYYTVEVSHADVSLPLQYVIYSKPVTSSTDPEEVKSVPFKKQ